MKKHLLTIIFVFVFVKTHSQNFDSIDLRNLINITSQDLIEGKDSLYNLRLRGSAYIELQEFEKALNDVELALDFSRDADLLNRRAFIKYNLGDWEGSLEDYNSAISISPKSDFFLGKGTVLEKLNKYSKALTNYTLAIEKDPNNVQAYINRANLHEFVSKDYESSLKDWNSILKIQPRNDAALNDRGLIYLKLLDYKKALRDFNSAINISREHANYFFNRGFAYGKLSMYSLAFNDFKMAISMEPNNPFTYYLRAIIYKDLEEFDKACLDLEKSQKLGFVDEIKIIKIQKEICE